jgi:NADPH-ferrihemoprotein reductase
MSAQPLRLPLTFATTPLSTMAQLDTLDIVVLAALLVGTIAYFTKGTYWAVAADPYSSLASANGAGKAGKSRNILEKMDETDKNCVVFYGSQTGTAEDYASRLSKEGHSRFGLKTMVADLEDYDFDNLDSFPEDKLAVFVLATYGEGEPTDNAVEFYEFIGSEDVSFAEGGGPGDKPLANMNYVAFGLGNNTYEHYNSMVRNVDKYLTKLGATRLGAAGEGDDGAGTMEEDFLAWKEPMWTAVADKMGLEEREAMYEPVFEVNERPDLSAEDDTVYLGEPNKNHLEGNQKGPYNANNPFIAPIVESSELFNSANRNCLHMEISMTTLQSGPTTLARKSTACSRCSARKTSATQSSQSEALTPPPRFPFRRRLPTMPLSAFTWKSTLLYLVNWFLVLLNSRPTKTSRLKWLSSVATKTTSGRT